MLQSGYLLWLSFRNNKTTSATNRNVPLRLSHTWKAHRVVAALADNDPAGKGLVVDLDVERPVPTVQCVLLDEVQVVYTSNLHVINEEKIHCLHIKSSNTKMLLLFCNLLIATAAPLSLASILTKKYPFKKPRGIYIDHTAPLRYQCRPVLTLALTDDLTVHKHWDQGALGEPPHVGLREEISHI